MNNTVFKCEKTGGWMSLNFDPSEVAREGSLGSLTCSRGKECMVIHIEPSAGDFNVWITCGCGLVCQRAVGKDPRD